MKIRTLTLVKKYNLKNRRFGNLKVLYLASRKCWKQGYRGWVCKCDCGNIITTGSSNLLSKNTKSCGCQQHPRKSKNPCWRGYKEISAHHFYSIKYSAKNRNLPFRMTIEQCWKLFIQQKERCALTGLKLNFQSCYEKRDGTASLDRIDSSKGYIEDNVQWIHKDVNYMKQDFTEEKLREYCKLITNYKKN